MRYYTAITGAGRWSVLMLLCYLLYSPMEKDSCSAVGRGCSNVSAKLLSIVPETREILYFPSK